MTNISLVVNLYIVGRHSGVILYCTRRSIDATNDQHSEPLGKSRMRIFYSFLTITAALSLGICKTNLGMGRVLWHSFTPVRHGIARGLTGWRL